MTARYVKTKVYKKTVGKACIISDCSTSATVVTQKIIYGMRTEVALCVEHAAERGLIDASS